MSVGLQHLNILARVNTDRGDFSTYMLYGIVVCRICLEDVYLFPNPIWIHFRSSQQCVVYHYGC